MKGTFFVLPLAFCLVILPYFTAALHVKAVDVATPVAAPTTVNGQIEKACQGAGLGTNLCVQTLKAQPGSDRADFKELAFMALTIAKNEANTTADFISKKLDKANLGPSLEQALTDCNDQYEDALAQIDDSMAAYFSNAYNDIVTWMGAAATNADTCQEGLVEAKMEEVMGDKNKVFAQLCNNVLSIVHKLPKQ